MVLEEASWGAFDSLPAPIEIGKPGLIRKFGGPVCGIANLVVACEEFIRIVPFPLFEDRPLL